MSTASLTSSCCKMRCAPRPPALLHLRPHVSGRRGFARPDAAGAQGAPAPPAAKASAAGLQRASLAARRRSSSRRREKQGLEGIMAKRASSQYLSGARSKDWLKIKTARRQEVVIAGFTAPRDPAPISAHWCWRFAKARPGAISVTSAPASPTPRSRSCTASSRPLRTSTSPFSERVKDEAVTTWVRPKLVAEVRFTEWTSAGEMRHPVFLGLREDKAAGDVMRESEKQAATAISGGASLLPLPVKSPPRALRWPAWRRDTAISRGRISASTNRSQPC